jgi:transposase-like protein
MSKTRRSFSVEQKLQIIQESEQLEITLTLRKHNLSPSLLGRWKHRFNSSGVAGLKPQSYRVDPYVRALE